MSQGRITMMEACRAGWFGKITATFTLFFFSFVFYLSPTGRALADELTEDEQRQQQIEQVLENTPEKKLAHRLQKFKNKVLLDIPRAQQQREEDSSLWDDVVAFFSGGGSLTSGELSDLNQLALDIDAAWQEAAGQFDQMQVELQNRNAAAVILERHQQARADFDARYQALQARITALLQDPDDATFNDLGNFLDQQQFKRRHTPLNPDRMPFGTPDKEVRKPFTEESDLQSYLGIDPYADYPQFAASQVTQEMLDAAFAQAGGPTAADLAETPEVQLTDAIRAKAEELNHDPITIYTWVHNNIRYIPSYGSIQGADMTLQTLRGNATDTASLLIALLRASDIPARYAYGVVDIPIDQAMNWVGGVESPFAAGNLMGQGGIPNIVRSSGGVATHMRQEHTWVEAFVDFEPSRGVKLKNLDSWVPMDASFKQYDFTEGYNLNDNVPFDPLPLIDQINATATVNEAEGWVQNVPQQAVEDQLNQFQQQLEAYINNQNPDATVGEVLGLKELKIIPPEPLSAGLPYQLVIKQQHYSEVPDSLRHKFRYTLSATDSYGTPVGTLLTTTKNTVELAGKKLALSFSPATADDEALIESYLPEPDPVTGEIDPNQLPDTLPGYLIHLTAEFTENGEVTQSASAGTMGGELHEELGLYSPAKGWITSRNYPTAGEYRAIGLDLQGSSPEQALQLQQNIEATQAILETEDEAQLATLTKHDVVGDLIYGTIYSYFALNNVQDEIAQQTANIVSYRAPSYGLFHTTLETQYWFGVPRNVQFSGLTMDVDLITHQTVDKNNGNQEFINYNRAIGGRYSGMEHLVPEHMFSTEDSLAKGVSAVKAMILAAVEGQKIYTINQNNVEQVLGEIQISAETEQEIRNAAYAGKEIVTHQNQLNFNGWIGEGYVIIDPQTGTGAYKIGGGKNGSITESESIQNQFAMAGLAPVSDESGISLLIGLILAIGGALASSVLVAVVGILFAVYSLWKDYVELRTAYGGCKYNELLDFYLILGGLAAILGLFAVGVGAFPAALLIWLVGMLVAGSVRAVLVMLCA